MQEILEERKSTHGDFRYQFACAQDIKNAMLTWGLYTMPAIERETLEMIAMKMSRAVTGKPKFADHWRDIEGYAKLVADMLEGKCKPL